MVTIAELHVGVRSAANTTIRAGRMATLDAASVFEPLPIDGRVAQEWARLRVRLAEEGRRAKVNDLWIAAVAMANGLPVVIGGVTG